MLSPEPRTLNSSRPAGWRVVMPAVAFALAFASARAAELPPKTFVNSIGMTMVPIPAGEFTMGCGEAPPESKEEWENRDWDESPAHRVTISRRFFMAACEVTNAQFERFDLEHKELRGQFRVSETDDEPVTMVTWQQAVDFCRWLSEEEGRPYRLPTEAEWEYACRAGTTTTFSTGESLTPRAANIGLGPDGKKRESTMPVGRCPANPWGLFDMHGNVEEWCLDWFGPYAAGPQTDPVGRADGCARVKRGGSYSIASWKDDNSRYCRSSNRSGHLPEDANRCTGFRVVLGEIPQSKPLPVPEPPPHRRDVKQTPAPKEGPPSDEPYFVNFTEQKKAPRLPENQWGPIFSQWNHFTACTVCPNGDVLAAWYTTVSESGRELAQGGSRLRAGSDRWDDASTFFDVPDINDHAPVLFCDGKRVYHFASQALRGWDDTSIAMRVSDDSGATWSKPRIVLPREHPDTLSQSCSALLARDGRLVLAADGSGHHRERLLTSRDGGRSWQVAGGDMRDAVGAYAIHPAIAPLDDGSIVAFLRGPDPMPRLVSRDVGESWEVGQSPFGGISVGQKAAVARLPGGGLLLCANDTRKPPITGERGTLAALSFDGGKTWPHVRHVPGVRGYLSVAVAPNGVIYILGTEIYDQMGCVALNEAWVRQREPR